MVIVHFDEGKESDVPILTDVMTRSFDDELKTFLGKPAGNGPPGYDDGSFLMKWGLSSEYEKVRHFYKIILVKEEEKEEEEEITIGAFIVFVIPDGKNFLGTIFIDPDYQDKGIGTKAMKYIFSTFPAKEWQLETPEWSKKNHHFYEKEGFIKIEEKWDPELNEEKGGAFSYIYNKKMDE
ncbi:MAG: GNAT family N-acetyltransferase [archaeon]|nr:GNAT family N-acetyltransferase [archaeon]